MNYNNFKKNQQVRILINKFKTLRDKIVRAKSTITFLMRCRNAGIIPKFISNSTKNISNIFKMEGLSAIQRNIYNYTQDLHNKILRLTLKEKHQLLKHFQSEIELIKRNLERYLTEAEMIEFLRYQEIIAASFNEKVRKVHKRKFECLKEIQKKELGIRFNKKWFINKTDLDIPTDVQWILSLGHKHALPVRREEFPKLNIITDAEDCIQTIPDKDEQEIARNRVTNVINNHLNRIRLTNRDIYILDKVKEAEIFLKRNKDILILRSDKGNTTVAIKKQDYDMRMINIVGDITKYSLQNRDPTSKLQKINNNLVEELFRKKIITNIEKNKLKTNIATAPRIYGLPKIHKEDFPLRPICSFINSPSYELCKYLTNILRKITERSKYNVKNSLEFKNRLFNKQIRDDEKLVSFDVVSLFPSIPVDLAINIIEEKWNVIEEYTTMEKGLFLRILKFCIEDNRYFQYSEKIYFQQKGLPMGSPASPIVADIVMEKLLDTCIEKLDVGPKIMTKYVDDLFCVISENAIENMLMELNEFSPDIKFTMEKEFDSKLSYLDTLVIRRGNNLITDWYQKPTASGRIINFYSKHNKRIIINTAKNLIEKVLTISDREFHRKNEEIIKNLLRDNDFPMGLICKLMNQYKFKKKNNTENLNEQKIYKSLVYVPGISECLEKSNIVDTNRYRIAFKSYNTVNKLYNKTKDRIQKLDMSNIVYKIPCSGNDVENCDKVYIGTTKNKLRTRIAGHRSDQKYRNVNSQKTALSSHCSRFNHYPDFENVSVLNTEHNYRRRYILEMLQIINTPTTNRINFKADIENVAQNYRYLIQKK